jgi:hypothetical protein
MEEKGKSFLERMLIPIIIVLVALASFGLGRLSVLVEEKESLIINSEEQTP